MIHVNLSFRVSLCVYGVQGWSPWRPQAMERLIKESVCLSLSLIPAAAARADVVFYLLSSGSGFSVSVVVL